MAALDNKVEERDPEIVLGTVDRETHFLLEGEEHLQQFLLADGVYPLPIGCIIFQDMISMRAFLGDGVVIEELWQINLKIIERLRENKELLEVDAPTA